MTLTQELKLEAEKFAWKPLLRATGWFILLLVITQALRAVIYQLLYRLLPLVGIAQTGAFWDVISMASMLLTGIPLLVILQPRAAQLGLDWQAASRKERLFTAAGGSFLLVMAIINLTLDPAQLAVLLHGCLVTPLFEELLFRGWGWGRIDAAMPARWRGWGTLVLVTLLFGLWHLGYTDVISLRMAAHPEHSASLGLIMGMKVVIGLAVGLLAGLARRRSRGVYGAMVVHALWNLFGK
jgi:membrane protease YdiL (CAAX protease family)